MPNYNVVIEGVVFEMEAASKISIVMRCRNQGYSVSYKDITQIDEIPEPTLSVHFSKTIVADLIALGMTDRQEQRRFVLNAVQEKIQQLKK